MIGESYNQYRTWQTYIAGPYGAAHFELAQIGPRISWWRRALRWAVNARPGRA